MPAQNTATRYGSVAKTLHWLTALLILTAIPLGLIATDMAHDITSQDSAALARVATLFSVHKTIGVTVFFVAVARILWALTQARPGLLNGDRRAEAFLAAVVHWALYGALVIVPLSGWVHHAAQTGYAPIWWPLGQTLPFVPQSTAWADTAGAVHWLATKVLIGALVLHIAGALKHHLVDRDGTLRRMLPGRAEAAPSTGQPGHAAPVAAALALWLGVLGWGVAGTAADTPEASLAGGTGEWQVQDGRLSITVQQFGSAVQGQFGNWQADIAFDPDSGTGEVAVRIAIPSLTLGSVTDQALGPDYFDAETHDTARFQAEIARAANADRAYVATGTLTLKGETVPVTLPFDLDLTDGVAQMEGGLTLDRRDFGIGTQMTDPAQLGFEVEVAVALTAERAR
ncbi:cytochrome b/b6 domain-containing protein [Lutimaribacter sp. EGI FJ00015]|uniref:Cytochrome b/b6 domain-containing protein n=1 Tax=Lutimaribacter degradans TaxID=2945989 RepID=A0ACC5ZT68_9RHOB|nr:cytochrome b/b6 domain-containing protein [Lutimaribacter sp. EGI FJ00013]MCM2561020.1 cytochrome b/b6 domain-containing protein [Lutimaribacter sp. EGI FJ00013]MCO0612033.1 cytochrome b/b6 domain-containing protein [Lutimaribacter sp. EGI FJ00015]MCO0634847.1 cytochrome b/b6 domain-containing protein [Lutimaribacter sp. EGI FJ00014]